jgi:D-3-phosphoglycerate dehydrogenase
MKRVLIVESLNERSIADKRKEWNSLNYHIDYAPEFSREKILESIHKYEAIIVGSHKIDLEIIKQWRDKNPSNLLAIVRAGSNTSTIDKKYAAQNNIVVMNTAGVNSRAVSEHINKRILDLTHNEMDLLAIQDIRNGVVKNRSNYYHDYAYGKTLALIGTGSIGSLVAKNCRALDIKVKAYSPHLTEDKAKSLDVEYCPSLETALEKSDFVSIQVPFKLLDQEYPTFNIIGKKEISLLNDGAKIINISRKNVINMDDLNDAIMSGKISGFSLDTMPEEIMEIINTYPELIAHKNVLLSASIATAANQLQESLTKESLKRIFSYWEDNQIIDRV